MATLNDIIGGIQTALTTGTSPLFTTQTCFLALDPESNLDFPPNQQFVTITPVKMVVKKRSWDRSLPNTGVIYMWSWSIDVTLFTQLSTDVSNHDTLFLTDASLGNLQKVDAILDAIQNFNLTSQGVMFGYELSDLTWNVKQRKTTGWGYCRISVFSDLSTRSAPAPTA